MLPDTPCCNANISLVPGRTNTTPNSRPLYFGLAFTFTLGAFWAHLRTRVAEGLAVSRLLVVHNRDVRFFNRGARKDCRKSSAERLKTNETVLTNSSRVFKTSSTALFLQRLPQRIFALYRAQKLAGDHHDIVALNKS
jgi:hypothetical protein